MFLIIIILLPHARSGPGQGNQSFRHAGGGTGKEIDIDDFDTAMVDPQKTAYCRWDPEKQGDYRGYRYYFPEKAACTN